MALAESPSNTGYYREIRTMEARQRLRSSLRRPEGTSSSPLRVIRLGRVSVDVSGPTDTLLPEGQDVVISRRTVR